MVSVVILDPHTVMKQAGMMEHTASNATGLRSGTMLYRYDYHYGGVNEVFTAEVTGQNG